MPIKMGQMVGLRTLSKFVVGKRKGEQINELNGLKHLSGGLWLTKLNHVKDSTEAKEADLANKPNLTSLRLCWEDYTIFGRPRFDLQEEEKKKSERVLECLQPHVLGIRELSSLKCIGVEFCGEVARQLKGFPSLENLSLEIMPDLEKWEFPLLNDALFPCLRKLRIWNCPKLETPSIFMPTSCCLKNLNSLTVCFPTQSLSNLTALQTLMISHKGSILPAEIENLTILKSLKIQDCYDIPDEIGNLNALESLRISICEKLIFLPAEGLQKLTSLNLNSFDISYCKSLKTLPAMGRMIQEGTMMKSSCCSLVVLWIQCCHSLTSVSEGLAYLSSLQTLSIGGCDELELKREDFQHLTCLRDLRLAYLPKLISVPDVQNLTALQSLSFKGDQNLRILPEGIQQHLTSLQSLQVHECHPDLHKRLEKNKGVDWPKISHIPKIDIRP
ncbi:Disease resistance protein rga2 [Thalictrum thalictroides]|uniref:Disease resistance protein rga2 n=1 Tax=Thalictrum thalictroides TaxID=46969 RepID=A0A7J6VEL5_THATH|nr:Disease resistance protein rga2 [Thalictrum thalictroides]